MGQSVRNLLVCIIDYKTVFLLFNLSKFRLFLIPPCQVTVRLLSIPFVMYLVANYRVHNRQGNVTSLYFKRNFSTGPDFIHSISAKTVKTSINLTTSYIIHSTYFYLKRRFTFSILLRNLEYFF